MMCKENCIWNPSICDYECMNAEYLKDHIQCDIIIDEYVNEPDKAMRRSCAFRVFFVISCSLLSMLVGYYFMTKI